MIRLSVETDKERLITLWQEAFGDSREAIELFWDNRYIPENTVVFEENGKLCSMLYLLDGKLSAKGDIYNSYYLYAAATLKEFRGRGIMRQMLDYAKNLAQKRNIDFICLKPAEESLYNFYEKNGYRNIFSCQTIRIDRTDALNLSFDSFAASDKFIWDKKALDYAEIQHKFYGGKSIRRCEGLLLYSIENETCYVKSDNFTFFRLNDILSESSAKYFEIEVPVGYKNSTVKKNGMALAVSENAKSIINEIVDAYLYFTLD